MRRKPFPRGFLGRGRRKAPVNWVSEYWENAISLNTLDNNALALCVINDIDGGASLVQQKYQLRRVIVELLLGLNANVVSEDLIGPSYVGCPWLLGIADAEDQDRENVKSAGLQSWLQSGRILQCGIIGFGYDQAVSGGLTRDGTIVPLPNISIDWRGRANMKPDDELWFVLQAMTHTLSSTDQADLDINAALIGYSRVLITKKGA